LFPSNLYTDTNGYGYANPLFPSNLHANTDLSSNQHTSTAHLYTDDYANALFAGALYTDATANQHTNTDLYARATNTDALFSCDLYANTNIDEYTYRHTQTD
jgi:hypothetical protein